MTISCSISFDDNPLQVFYSGQVLPGRVILTLTEEKTLRGDDVMWEGDEPQSNSIDFLFLLQAFFVKLKDSHIANGAPDREIVALHMLDTRTTCRNGSHSFSPISEVIVVIAWLFVAPFAFPHSHMDAYARTRTLADGSIELQH